MAAAAVGVVTAPPPPRGTEPPGCSDLLFAAAIVVMYLWFASSWAWLFFAGCAAAAIGRAACGDDCPDGLLVLIGLILCALSSVVVCPLAVMLLRNYMAKSGTADKKELASSMSSAAATRELLGGAVNVTLAKLTVVAFAFVEAVGFLVKCTAAQGSRRERIGSVIIYVGCLQMSALFDFVILPKVARKLWRM